MPTGTVTGLVIGGNDQTGVAGVTITAIIRPAGATRISDGSDIANVTALTDTHGNWSMQLEQATNISPLSYWEIVEQVPGQSRVTAVRVPGNATYNVQSIRIANVEFPVIDVAPQVLPAAMTIKGGNNQSTPAFTTFSQVLSVFINDTNNQPVVGDSVTFTVIPGPNGGTATFSGTGTGKYTTATDSTGVASSAQLTANGTADTYTVVATESVVGVNATFTEVIASALVPSAPTITNAVQTSPNTVTVNFTPGATNGATVTGYILTVLENGSQTFVASPSLANPQILGPSPTILVNGHTYTFTLTTVAATGVQSTPSAPSASVLIVAAPTVPGAPGVPSISNVGDGFANGTWTAPASNGGSPISSYTLQAFRVSDNVHVGVDFTSLDGATFTGQITGLVDGTACYMQVFATNAVGPGPSSGPSASFTPATFPGVPTGVAATGSPFGFTVTWVAPASNGGSPITSYTVWVYNSSDVILSSIQGVSPTATSQAVSGLQGDTTYKVGVQALNAIGVGNISSPHVSVTTTLASPTVTGLSPTNGPAAGGTSLVITGTSFDSSATVNVGNNPATGVTLNSPTQLTVTTPSGTGGGSVDVVVTTTAGPSPTNPSDKFTYNPSSAIPTVIGFDSPFAISTAGGTINVHGTGFTGATAVKIGTSAVTSFSVTSDTVISLTQAAHGHGFFHVEVTNSVGPSNHTPADLLIIGSPGIGQVTPSSGTTVGGTPISVIGVGLNNGAATVKINGNNCTSVVVVNDNKITCNTPASTGLATGTFDTVVTNTNGTSDSFAPDKFTYTVSTPTPSIQRLIAANTAATHTVTPALVANVDLLVVQPQQIAGYTKVQPSQAAASTMDQLRAGNPDLVIVCYINSTHETGAYLDSNSNFWAANSGGPVYNPVDKGPNNVQSWYCYDSSGQKINGTTHPTLSIPGNLMYLQSTGADGHGHTGFQAFLGDMLNTIRTDPVQASQTSGGWNGIFLDVLGDGSGGRNQAINPATGHPFADSFDGGKSWQDVCAQGGAAMLAGSNFASTYICGNSINNAQRYNTVPTSDIFTVPASGHLTTAMIEQYGRTAPNSPPFALPGTSGNTPTYQTTINAIDDATRVKGAIVWTIMKLWSSGADLDVDRWSRLGLAMLLCGGQGYSSIAMQMESASRPATSAYGATTGGAADWTHYTLLDCTSTAAGAIPGIGNPTDLTQPAVMTDASGIFYRAYQFGYVFLNSMLATITDNNVALPTGTIHVSAPNCPVFPNTGTLLVVNDSAQTTTTTVNYTGVTNSGGHTTSFTGCTGGTGTLFSGNAVGIAANIPFGLPSTGAVGWRDCGPTVAGTPGNTHYADGATPSVPAFSALILKISA